MCLVVRSLAIAGFCYFGRHAAVLFATGGRHGEVLSGGFYKFAARGGVGVLGLMFLLKGGNTKGDGVLDTFSTLRCLVTRVHRHGSRSLHCEPFTFSRRYLGGPSRVRVMCRVGSSQCLCDVG